MLIYANLQYFLLIHVILSPFILTFKTNTTQLLNNLYSRYNNNSHTNHCQFILKMSDSDVGAWVKNLVSGHKVVVFSKSHCPFCVKAVDTLKSLNPKDMHVEQIENNKNMDKIQDFLCELTGARTVPRVFIGGSFFGDASFTVKSKEDGKLERRLREAGSL